MTETYIVQQTVPDFGLKPMPHILVDGKVQFMPVRLNLQSGDRVVIERVNRGSIAVDQRLRF